MKQKFDLSLWLQDKSRKVVTRDGREVRIICTNCKSSALPIIAEIQNPKTNTWFIDFFNVDGTVEIDKQKQRDLFFADEEEELTKFEKELQIIISDASHWTSDDGSISTYCQFGDKEIKKISAQILDLARKELQPEFDKEMDKMLAETDKVVYQKGYEDALKSLPKWKRSNSFFNTGNEFELGKTSLRCFYGYEIPYSELKKLPKEE